MGIYSPKVMVTPFKASDLYQPGDFIRDSGGKTIAYAGPVYNIEYPDGMLKVVDRWREVNGWLVLGYSHVKGIMNHGTDWTVNLWGDIPQYLKDNLQRTGIEIKLTKERGKSVSIDGIIFIDPGI